MLTPTQAHDILASAEQLCSPQAVKQAVRRVARDVTRVLADDYPLVLSVMSGAIVFSGQLLPLLKFPLAVDYVHVTRYGDALRGGRVECKVFPEAAMAGRTVLVLDDVLDEGHTMLEIRARVLAGGAARFYSAVLVDKDLGAPKSIKPDFVGLRLPNRFLFGFGMDVHGAWRNLAGIYALKANSGVRGEE